MKRCRRCGIEKPRESFYRLRKASDGLGTYCKQCHIAIAGTRPDMARPVKERLRKGSVDIGDCWIWQGVKDPAGYGQIKAGGKTRRAHRVSYEAFIGPIPEGLVIDHLCRNAACVNPAHLEPVTNRENGLRGIKGILTTQCPRGHPYDERNTGWSNTGHRFCKTCNNARCRRNRAIARDARVVERLRREREARESA